MTPPRTLMIAAPQSSAGKTIITAGLLRAYRRRGTRIGSVKSGPDYLDPAFHTAAGGAECVNLDAWAMSPQALRARAATHESELMLIEAAMGLLDGAPDADDPWGRGSSADLAIALGAPVVLVLDVARQAQSAAALALGMKTVRPDLRIAGVLLNRVGSTRHAEMISRACAAADLAVLGAVPRSQALKQPSRHLGLVQARERVDLDAFLDGAADLLTEHVDLDLLERRAAPLRRKFADRSAPMEPIGQRIAVARDDAFAFIYTSFLQDWRAAGAEITFFSPLENQSPAPDSDAIFLPGGYPELHVDRLAAATACRDALHSAAAREVLIYGECGGYMALGEGLVDAKGARGAMFGLLPLETSFAERKLHLGYRKLIAIDGAPLSGRFAGHEFHYASTLREGDAPALFDASDSMGAPLAPMGMHIGRTAGSFAHLIAPKPASPYTNARRC